MELEELNKDLAKEEHVQDPEEVKVKSKKSYHPDGLTQVIGEVGCWQVLCVLIPVISVACHAWMMMSNKFLTFKTDHWCSRPEALADMNVSDWLSISAPILDNGDFDRCHVFDVDFELAPERPAEDTPTIPCPSFEYDESLFQNTAIKRWDLVCGRKYMPRLIQTIFFVGNFVGVLLSGVVADRYGRKFCYLLFLTLWVIFGVVSSFTRNLYGWILVRFICGALSLGYNNSLAVYGMETTHGKWRAILGNLFGELFWNLGHMSLGGLAYGIRNMYTLELVIGLSASPFILLWFVMPESPRWLLASGKKEKAKQVMIRACKMNGKPVEPVEAFVDEYKVEADSARGNIVDLFRTPAMRRNSIMMCLAWLSFSMGYFGLIYNTPAFNWSVFWVFIFPAFIMVAMSITEPFLENLLGRKFMLSIPLISAGTVLLITTVMPTGSSIIIFLAWFGTVLCGLSFAAGYVFTRELYPTSVRTIALSTASASARIGSIISPFIAMLDEVHEVLPLAVYGIVVFVCGCLSIFIWPETKGLNFPANLEECEAMASSRNKWLACCCCQREKDKIVQPINTEID